MLREQKDGWCWQEPNGVEGLEDRGWAVGSLTDHGTKFGFYSPATGSLWRVVSRGTSGSALHFLKIRGLFC